MYTIETFLKIIKLGKPSHCPLRYAQITVTQKTHVAASPGLKSEVENGAVEWALGAGIFPVNRSAGFDVNVIFRTQHIAIFHPLHL